jgi:predicted amidohydrolase YtcJ
MAETLFRNGLVRTLEEERPRASAVLVREGVIAAVGDDAEVAALAPTAQTIDLGGRTLVPGFNDAHIHVWKVGHLLTTMLDLRGAPSLDVALNMLQAHAARTPADRPLLGRGIDENRLRENRLPTRAELDAATPGRAVWLTRVCGHVGIANSRALELAEIGADTPAPRGGVIDRDVRGNPTGVLRETAMALVTERLPAPTVLEYASMIEAAHAQLLRQGVTSATDPGVDPELLAVYRELDERARLAVRMNVMALAIGDDAAPALPAPYVTPTLRIDTVKFFLDGALSGGSAALRGQYVDGSRGILRRDEASFYEPARAVHRCGLRIAAHAIGDRAIECALSVYERLRREGPGRRHRIEHGGLVTKDQLARLERGRHPLVMQPIFLREMAANYRRYLPPDFPLTPYPLRAVLDAKCDLALSSDAPVVEDSSPLAGIATAVTRKDKYGVVTEPRQSISAGEALRAATLGGAIASGDEHDRGSLRAGKRADLVVLDRDPVDVASDSIAAIKVDLTMVDGVVRYER